ncbi:LysM peptidoglycan-binding domain-containing protein [Actinomyces bowdenii]|nr:LysM peptidoglycan-binding domain-containing protein [Actinomyces bowdenii]MCR2053627.1 LysM peptidoglycan-binding domain-containing protein [Actinomyces bowdenii]
MSATIAPPRPSAGNPRQASSRRPALRLVPSTGVQDPAAPAAQPHPAPRPQVGSRPARHLRLVTSAAIDAVTGMGIGAGASRPDGIPLPLPPSPTGASPGTAAPTGAAVPLTPPATAPSLRAPAPRRPGEPLALRDPAVHPSSRPESGPGATQARSERRGARIAAGITTGIAALPDPPRRTSAPARRQGFRTAAGSTTPAGRAASTRASGRMALLAPNHPAVRSARIRSAQEATLGAGGARALPATQQPAPRRSASSQALPLPVRRFIAALGACLMVIMLISSGLVVSGLASTQPTRTTTTVVQPGQSLWEVASATGSSDVPQTVATIVELNDLDSPTIHAGETLTIPVH